MNNTYLTPTRYTLTISGDRFTNFASNVIDFPLPSVSVNPVSQSTPKINVPVAGSKIEYSDLALTIIIDGAMENYASLYDWLRDTIDVEGETYDLIVTIYNISEQPVKRVKFRNCFVNSLSEIKFNSNSGQDAFLTFVAGFKYTYFEILSA